MSELKYEDALKRLEKLVEDLDSSDLGLEARLKKFEEGTKLARALLKKLEQAKKKVDVLVNTKTGEPSLAPADEEAFGAEEASGDEDDDESDADETA